MNGSVKNSNRLRYAIIIAFTAVYLLLFSVTTSPLYKNYYGGDSAFFILVGKGMKYGYLPYRDFYDMKGPWLFFLEWMGQMVSEGRSGAFLIQSINLSASMIMFDKLMRIGREEKKLYDVVLLLPLFLTAIFSLGGGNLTEELSLFPLSVCLYLGTNHIFDNSSRHNYIYAGVYGFFFGLIALIRITNAALICSIVLTILIGLIANHEWGNILENAVAFIIGFVGATFPVLLFFQTKGLLSDMLSQVFIYGAKYSSASSDKWLGIRLLITGPYKAALYPVFIGLLISLMLLKRNPRLLLLQWISTISTLAAIALSGLNFEHYYGLLIPVVALSVLMIRVCFADSRAFGKRVLATAGCIVFLVSFFGIVDLDKNYVVTNVFKAHSSDVDNAITDVSKHITDDGSVYCWTEQPRWYMYANRFPCYRYCGWQTYQMTADSRIKDELSLLFFNYPPDWLVLNTSEEMPDFVLISKNRYFKEVYRNDYWILYRKSRETDGNN